MDACIGRGRQVKEETTPIAAGVLEVHTAAVSLGGAAAAAARSCCALEPRYERCGGSIVPEGNCAPASDGEQPPAPRVASEPRAMAGR